MREGSRETSAERRETGPIRREYEYRDKEGRLLGRAKVELDPEPVETAISFDEDGEEKERGHRLRSFRLIGEKDGAPAEADVLALANPHGVEVFVAAERAGNYAYSNSARQALVPPLENPVDVAVLLHELGHGDQYHDPRFGKVGELYGDSKMVAISSVELRALEGKLERARRDGNDAAAAMIMKEIEDLPKMLPGSYSSLKRTLDAVIEAVPEAAQLADAEFMAQAKELDARRNALLEGKSAMERRLQEIEPRRGESPAIDDEIDLLERLIDRSADDAVSLDRMQRLIIEEMRIGDVLAIPVRIMERDATNRAIRWMRKLRDLTGADLFPRVVVPRDAVTEMPAHCVAATERGFLGGSSEESVETTVVEDLRRALESYGARKMRMRKPGDEEGPAVTPTPGGHRTL